MLYLHDIWESISIIDDYKQGLIEEEVLPDEENFKPEFVEEIQRRDKEYNKSDSIVCHTKEESDAILKKSWNEND